MKQLTVVKYSFADYIPLFIILCFSGNPLFTTASYSKPLLVLFCAVFVVYSLLYISAKDMKIASLRLLTIITIIIILCVFQKATLGFVSFPGVFALILKIILGMFFLLYYHSKNMNPFDVYIKIMEFLAIVSIPLFALNFLVFIGLPLDIYGQKSLFFYTSFDSPKPELRNAGMFWEAGAFAGYLTLALLFIVIQNRKFVIGQYSRQVIWILIGLLTSMSTTGVLVLVLIIIIYILQNYKIGSLILIPVVVAASIYAYNNLDFLNKKIEEQFEEAVEMEASDVSNTRFGSLNMDVQYITDQPLTGNGLDKRTRYRFHPWVDDDIGHGNGMSNFLVFWGIPFFLFWVFCVFQFAKNGSGSISTAILFVIMVILLLQGEQYLNYPIFLMFFSAPIIEFLRYDEVDIMTVKYTTETQDFLTRILTY